MKARGILRGFDYKGVRSTGSKVTRAEPVSAAAEHGKIKVVRGCRNLEVFFAELEGFPDGAHDDMLDALSGAFADLGVLPKVYLPIEIVNYSGSYWGESVMQVTSAQYDPMLQAYMNSSSDSLGYFGRI